MTEVTLYPDAQPPYFLPIGTGKKCVSRRYEEKKGQGIVMALEIIRRAEPRPTTSGCKNWFQSDKEVRLTDRCRS